MQMLPKAMGLVLCERMEVNPQQGRYSLVNVFIALPWHAPGPLLKSFTVYGTLFDGNGEGRMDLVVTQVERERAVHKYSRWYASPGRGMSHLFEIKVTNCLFPAPGRYSITLLIDSEELAVFYLDVIRR